MLTGSIITTLLAAGTLADAASDNTVTEAGSHDNSNECECYLVSGVDPGYFQYYRYWDWTNIPVDQASDTAPPLITAQQNDGGQNVTSDYLNTSQWDTDWSIQNTVEEADSAVPSVNSAQNVYISQETRSDGSRGTYLTLRASRLPDFASIAEIDSNQKNLFYSSIRARARLLPIFGNATNTSEPAFTSDQVNTSHPVEPGAVLGIFTYESDTEESDIEILTYDPITNVRYSNQPDFNYKTGDVVPGASTDLVLPSNMVWTDWHDHRIDWFKGVSRWYVDGMLVLEKTLNVPKKPSGLVLNLWSDGGNWSGNMTVGAQVEAGIQWVEMAFNTSGPVNGPSHHRRSNVWHEKRRGGLCNVGCSIDQVQTKGYPLVTYNVTSMSGSSSTGHKIATGMSVASLLTVYAFAVLAGCVF